MGNETSGSKGPVAQGADVDALPRQTWHVCVECGRWMRTQSDVLAHTQYNGPDHRWELRDLVEVPVGAIVSVEPEAEGPREQERANNQQEGSGG